MMRAELPKLYVILDAGQCGGSEVRCAKELLDVGVRLFQYRSKTAPAREVLQTARELAQAVMAKEALFLVNDRPDVAHLAGASGVHVGQSDLTAEDAKRIMGPEKLIGVSTHDVEQFKAAMDGVADYIALGPIYATSTKEKPDPVVGTALLKQLRRLTEKPIVAIGGITLERAREVIEAGADSVAVAHDILSAPNPVERAQQYVEMLKSVRSSRTN